jgi:ABC-type uncharacterized transport system substrate-binding protein
MVPRRRPASPLRTDEPMIRRLRFALFVALTCWLGAASAALAHPHVWVTMKSEVLYAADGSITGVRHTWAFDEMFSTFATQGIETKQKGVFTREELKPLADVNVNSLKEYDYFTHAKANGKKTAFVDPIDHWLEFTNGVLILHFTLPLKAPVKAQALNLEVYDPTWFVDFAFADKEPVALVGAPAGCRLSVVNAADTAAASTGQQLGESFFNSLGAGSNYGAQFANKVSVQCP